MIVLVALVWNFSSKFQRNETSVSFSEFIVWVDSGQVARVQITGNELTGITLAKDNFRTYIPAAVIDHGAATAVVDARTLGDHLIVRPRRPGDRLQPLGAPGRRKVQDVLVDRKVPRDDRDRVPIVTTEKGDIVWVAGQVLADPYRVTSLTSSVVILTLRRN